MIPGYLAKWISNLADLENETSSLEENSGIELRSYIAQNSFVAPETRYGYIVKP